MTAHLTFRNLALTVIAAVLVAAMLWLGRWQFRAYDHHQSDDAARRSTARRCRLTTCSGPTRHSRRRRWAGR